MTLMPISLHIPTPGTFFNSRILCPARHSAPEIDTRARKTTKSTSHLALGTPHSLDPRHFFEHQDVEGRKARSRRGSERSSAGTSARPSPRAEDCGLSRCGMPLKGGHADERPVLRIPSAGTRDIRCRPHRSLRPATEHTQSRWTRRCPLPGAAPPRRRVFLSHLRDARARAQTRGRERESRYLSRRGGSSRESKDSRVEWY